MTKHKIEGHRVEELKVEENKQSNLWILTKLLFKAFFFGIAFALFGGLLFAFNVYKSISNDFKRVKPKENVTQTVFYDKNGGTIYESYGAGKPEKVTLKDMPDNLIKATLAAEDLDFYKHEAYDLKGILRAVYKNYQTSGATGINKLKVLFDENSYTEGGSTITQQLVKNRYLTNERKFDRKLKEIIYSIELEKEYSKDEILGLYLSDIYYGEQSLGIKNAAKVYFDKDVKDLTLAEISILSGLPAAPTRYSPVSGDFFESKKRQEYVLQRMYIAGFISLDEAKNAANEELVFANKKEFLVKYPFFVDWLKEELYSKYGKEKVESGGLKVHTTLDPAIQDASEKIASEQVKKFASSNVSNASAIVMNPSTNEVYAMIGGVNYSESKVNVATALRQPGSSFKPVVYFAGLEKGFTASSKLIDKYMNFGGIPPYTPKNYDGHYRGYVTIREALSNSLNIPAVEMLSLVGLDKVIEYANKLGITMDETAKNCGLSLALGCKESRLIDIVNTYATFASNGVGGAPTGILKVEDSEGNNVTIKNQRKQILDKANSYIITNILSDEKARRKVFGAGNKLEIKRPAAAKTGTTDNYTDSWTIGYTPDYVVGVWLGNNDRKPMKVISGIEGAAYVWHDIMVEINKDKPVKYFERPAEVTEKRINPQNGEVINAKSGGVIEVFKEGTEPKGKEDLSHLNVFK